MKYFDVSGTKLLPREDLMRLDLLLSKIAWAVLECRVSIWIATPIGSVVPRKASHRWSVETSQKIASLQQHYHHHRRKQQQN